MLMTNTKNKEKRTRKEKDEEKRVKNITKFSFFGSPLKK